MISRIIILLLSLNFFISCDKDKNHSYEKIIETNNKMLDSGIEYYNKLNYRDFAYFRFCYLMSYGDNHKDTYLIHNYHNFNNLSYYLLNQIQFIEDSLLINDLNNSNPFLSLYKNLDNQDVFNKVKNDTFNNYLFHKDTFYDDYFKFIEKDKKNKIEKSNSFTSYQKWEKKLFEYNIKKWKHRFLEHGFANLGTCDYILNYFNNFKIELIPLNNISENDNINYEIILVNPMYRDFEIKNIYVDNKIIEKLNTFNTIKIHKSELYNDTLKIKVDIQTLKGDTTLYKNLIFKN
jgi:hypothetical protein